MRERVIADYHELLAIDEGLSSELFERLKNAMRARRMLYGEREVGISLRPHFLTRYEYDHLVDRTKAVSRALDKVARAMVFDPSLMDKAGLTAREKHWALVDPGYSAPAITTRMDSFIIGGEVKFVEYNAENPSSLPDQAILNQILFEVGALHNIAERFRLTQFDPVSSLLDSLLATYREWNGEGTPNIAILDWANLPTGHEFELLRNHFISHGIPTIICTPEELEYQGGQLHRRDFRIDLVYKRVIIHEFFERFEDHHPLLRACRDRAVCLINPFRCKTMHKKASFEFLTDEAYQKWFDNRELEAILSSVPWTRRLSERKTDFYGRQVDLVEQIRNNRERFVLKPNDDYGGHGLTLGNRVNQSEWDEHISRALESDYVVQELLDVTTEEFPIFNERGWQLSPMFVDTNPFLFRGEVDGAMVRLADSPVVNVTSGGGETGLFILESELE